MAQLVMRFFSSTLPIFHGVNKALYFSSTKFILSSLFIYGDDVVLSDINHLTVSECAVAPPSPRQAVLQWPEGEAECVRFPGGTQKRTHAPDFRQHPRFCEN